MNAVKDYGKFLDYIFLCLGYIDMLYLHAIRVIYAFKGYISIDTSVLFVELMLRELYISLHCLCISWCLMFKM